MKNEITIDGVVYVKKEKQMTTVHEIPAKKLVWGATAPEKLNWDEAKTWCEEQGEGWRLPTRLELLCAFDDKIDGFGSSDYWSSTENSATFAYDVYFSDGNTYDGNKNNGYAVRCVRGW